MLHRVDTLGRGVHPMLEDQGTPMNTQTADIPRQDTSTIHPILVQNTFEKGPRGSRRLTKRVPHSVGLLHVHVILLGLYFVELELEDGGNVLLQRLQRL